MDEQEKDCELYRNRTSHDNLIEIAIIDYFNERSSYKIKLLAYENGSCIYEEKFELDNDETKKKFLEITKLNSLIWERKNASEKNFEDLKNCYDCVDAKRCMGCDVFLSYINVALIS